MTEANDHEFLLLVLIVTLHALALHAVLGAIRAQLNRIERHLRRLVNQQPPEDGGI